MHRINNPIPKGKIRGNEINWTEARPKPSRANVKPVTPCPASREDCGEM